MGPGLGLGGGVGVGGGVRDRANLELELRLAHCRPLGLRHLRLLRRLFHERRRLLRRLLRLRLRLRVRVRVRVSVSHTESTAAAPCSKLALSAAQLSMPVHAGEASDPSTLMLMFDHTLCSCR